MTNLLVIVAARNEADRIGATLDSLAAAFPGAELWVADDASDDGTAGVALAHGAQVVSRGRPHGKGANMTAATEAALSSQAGAAPQLALLCDGYLGGSAAVYHLALPPVPGGGDGSHAHLQCTRCHKVIDIGVEIVHPLVTELDQSIGFHFEPQHTALLGLCADCR